MARVPRLAALAALTFVLAACDGAEASECPACDGFDPSAVDYDAVTTLDFEDDVRPLLVARNVLSPTPTAEPGSPDDYTLDALVAAGPSGFVVPFDGAGSLIVRFVADLPDTTAIPFPNLRRLEPDELRFVRRWIEAGARDGDRVPFADARHLLFACVQNENHVAILDAETMRVVRRVYFNDHGLPSAPYGPHHVAFEPGGGAWYVSLISAGAVVKLSTSLTVDPSDPAYVLGRTPAGEMTTPGMLVLDPTAHTDGVANRLYVGRSTLSDATTSGFAILDRETMAVEEVATPFNVPHAMAVTPDGKYVLTASLTGNQVAVYDAATGDLALQPVPGGPHELIHFSVLGAHHGREAADPHAGHGGADPSAHAGHGAATRAMHAYEATLTSRTTDTVLFYNLSATGELTLNTTAPGGDGPWHAHVGHDGRTLLVPNRNGDAVTLLDAVTRATLRTVAPGPDGPLAQPHSPAPGHDGAQFYVTSSNLIAEGAWSPPHRFLGPAGPGGARAPLPATAFGNVVAFAMDGTVLDVVQLGAGPSGLEPFTVGSGGHH